MSDRVSFVTAELKDPELLRLVKEYETAKRNLVNYIQKESVVEVTVTLNEGRPMFSQ